MNNFPVQKAWKAYKEGRLKDALDLFRQASEKINVNCFKSIIMIFEKKLGITKDELNTIAKYYFIPQNKNEEINTSTYQRINVTDKYISNFNNGFDINFELKNDNFSYVEIVIDIISRPIVNNAVLLAINLYDCNRNICFTNQRLPFSQACNGCFKYLNQVNELFTHSLKIELTDKINTINLNLKHWKKNTNISIKSISIDCYSIEKQNIDTIDMISNFLKRKNVLIIYTTAQGFDKEGYIPLRSHNMCNEFAKLGYSILYIPWSSSIDHFIKSNNVLQVNRRYIYKIIDLLKDKKDIHFICSSIPDITAMTMCSFCQLNDIQYIYEIRDDMEAFYNTGKCSKWYNNAIEYYICKNSSIIFSVSKKLTQKAIVMSNNSKKCFTICNGVSEKYYDLCTSKLKNFNLDNRIKSKKIGYIGSLTDAWFDWDIVISVAKKLPDIQFEFIGFDEPTNIILPDNIYLLGKKTQTECIDIALKWRLGIIPFIPSQLTYAVDPNKIYEYFSLGLPCVAVEMSSIEKYPYTFIYKNKNELISIIKKIFSNKNIYKEHNELRNFSKKCFWEERAKEQLQLMEKIS